MATFSPLRKVLDSKGGTFSLKLTLGTSETQATGWHIEKAVESDVYSVNITSTSTTYCNMSVTTPSNTGTVDKNFTFYVVKEGAANPVRYRYAFTVQYNQNNISTPIWKDTLCSSNSSVLDYTIYMDDVPIYKGKTYAEPDAETANVRVNNICADYLSSSLPNGISGGYIMNYDYAKLFVVKQKNDSVVGEKAIAQYMFYNSYSYDDGPSTVFNSDPIKRTIINGIIRIDIDRRQHALISAYSKSAGNRTLYCRTVRGGSIQNLYNVVLDNTSEYINMERSMYYNEPLVEAVTFSTDNNNDGMIYCNIIDSCYDYCLYYCNAYGGWDSLLIKGNVKRTDNIDSKYYNKNFNNTTQDFEKKKFVNLITPTYTLYTDWFNDDEQSRLHHLLESTEVYLHNLVTDKIEPVNITNTQCEYKTFTNNGKKKWTNTINVEVAQSRIRRG